MSFYRLESKLRRSKSTGALDSLNTVYVDPINLKDVSNNHDSASSAQDNTATISETSRKNQIAALKRQIQKLQDTMQQQQIKLRTIKDDLKISYNVKNNIVDLFEDSVKTLEEIEIICGNIDCLDSSTTNQASLLLAAIEAKKKQRVDVKMKDAASKLPKLLEDDKVKERFSYETGNLPSTLDGCFPENLPRPYRPILKLTNWVHDLFTRTLNNTPKTVDEFEEGSVLLLKAMRRTPLLRDGVCENHHATTELDDNFKLQNNKLKKSCDKLPKLLTLQTNLKEEYYPENLPPSPPQPADPEVSIIDHLMQSALINKRIEEGQFNKAFEEALSSCNLALVMSACRAADPADVFDARCLSQSVLLSLVQQLATDMVHETQLKCRYLEEALINLDVRDQVTRAHLPIVVGEVRKHLSKFVRSYPYHVASRRIALIILAADNLMK